MNAVRVLFGVCSLFGLVACIQPPEAATKAVRSRSPNDLAMLAPPERQAHTLARTCEGGDVEACDRLGAAYWSGYGVMQHRFHALSLWEYTCARGIGSACEQAADVYTDGKLLRPNPERVDDLLERGCAVDRATACTRLGVLAMSGRTSTPNPRRAVKLWKKACIAGDSNGCRQLGLATIDGRGTAHDPEAGIALLVGACAADSAAACRQLAGFHRAGMLVPKSEAKAQTAELRACELGDGASCTELGLRARNTGEAEVARTQLESGCMRGDPRGCALLGDLYALGADGVPIDADRAALAYAEACRGGLFEACGRAAAAEGTAGIDPEELRVLYRVACDAGMVEACDYLAGMFLDGVGGPADPQAAARLFDRACIGAYADSCVHLAWMGRGDRGREPLQWLERACDLDDRACVVLGEVHEQGLVDGAKVASAADAYQRGCAADEMDACFRLGGMFSRGVGVKHDDPAAARLFQIACDANHADACAALGRAYDKGVGVTADATTAAHYRDRGCALGASTSCTKSATPPPGGPPTSK